MVSQELLRTTAAARDLWQSYGLLKTETVPMKLRTDAFVRILSQVPGIEDARAFEPEIEKSLKVVKDNEPPPIVWQVATLATYETGTISSSIRTIGGISKHYAGYLDVSFNKRKTGTDDMMQLGVIFSLNGGLVAFDLTKHHGDDILGYLHWRGVKELNQKSGDLEEIWAKSNSSISNMDLLPKLVSSFMKENEEFNLQSVLTEVGS